jgi:hypothetical protein
MRLHSLAMPLIGVGWLIGGSTPVTAQSAPPPAAEARANLEALVMAQGAQLEQQGRELAELRQALADLNPASQAAAAPMVATPQPTTSQQSAATPVAASAASAAPGDVAVKIGGWIQLDMLYFPDARPGESEDLLYPRLFSVDRTAQGRGRFRASARDTRLNVDVRTATAIGNIRAFTEFDFFGTVVNNAQSQFNAYDPRLRHAFVEWSNPSGKLSVLGGQNWSLFADPVSYASMYNPLPLGSVFVRQAQLRLTYRPSRGLSLAASLENPQADAAGAAGGAINEQFDPLPDLVVSARLERPWGALQLGGLLREMRETSPQGSATAWGVSGSGLIKLPLGETDQKLRFQATYGNGVGRYIGELGAGFDGQIAPGEELRTNRIFAGNISYEHSFVPWLSGSIQGSYVHVGSPPSAPGTTIETVRALAGNIVFHPIKKLDVAFEYIVATRANIDKISATRDIMRFTTRYQF